ncbi:SAC3/GANP/Nin1/mts3/eIF-3 p25 family-domain-containing protein [Hypomontagnella monticulosa]|nr:SAC3/GANP/Nin1/mts3/eIF-3 p25 family-domain-containing protein [Hypomontagnella monticulosa]
MEMEIPDETLPTQATTAKDAADSSSHLWQQARESVRKCGSWRFSFVSLSACLPCLIPKRTTPLSSNPQEQTTPISPSIRQIEIPSNPSIRPPGGTIPIPELAKAPKPPPPEPEPEPNNIAITTGEAITPSTSPASPLSPPPLQLSDMADRALQQILTQLRSNPSAPYSEASSLLSKAKIALLQLKAATPGTPGVSQQNLTLARDVYEQGALFSIRARNPDAFTRYVAQLQPFYELFPSSSGSGGDGEDQRNKITGLYLLLLLTQGRYAEFHSELETLGTRAEGGGGAGEIEGDRYLGYPIKLERWLMEGSYDRVWKAMKSREVPSEEYGVFSEILTSQIRSEIASSSERAYPSLPLSSTKSLLFLESEGAVVEFAHHRGWLVRDGQIYFPSSAATADGEAVAAGAEEEGDEKEFSRMVIENALGYARELETIV